MIFSSVPVICALEGWRDEWNKVLDLLFTLGQVNPEYAADLQEQDDEQR